MFKLVIAELPDTNWNLQRTENARTRDLPLPTGIMQ